MITSSGSVVTEVNTSRRERRGGGEKWVEGVGREDISS